MATTAVTNTLNSLERTQLRNAEAVLQRHVGAFVEVGNALTEIRDKRLYRETHKTFEAYISAKWDLERRYAYRLIEASGVAENVAHGPQTQPNLSPNLPKPTSERQVRPLTALPPEKQTEAWQAAVEKAEELGKPVTAAIVEQVVEEMKPPESAPSENGETPDVAASVLLAKNTDKIKPTRDQLVKLAAMPEKQQNAIMRAVEDGMKLSQAMKAAKPLRNGRPIPEKNATPADEARTQIEIWAATVGRWLGQSPSIDELRGQFPGKQGDAVVGQATALYESLKNWQNAIR